MTELELLAPARNKDIGIAAIDCGADAVYIAGPDFGARKAAGNGFEDIRELCAYAHQFGARIFVTFNTIIEDGELELAHARMLEAQQTGADAFIIRDPRIALWQDITVPLHASTQCAIRDPERALAFERLGCSRIILERELSLDQVRQICRAVSCEVEFFVHGALCVCYSGDCRLSEYLDGRSADKGECIQACRSLYDLYDGDGRQILKKKAVLSLKDYNLRGRLEDLAEAGVCSFKIEGRLKNSSYVRNVVRDYSLALDSLVRKYPDRYRRASFGTVTSGFTPDTAKTFNRGYTELFLDGRRGRWSSMDAPKSMGEAIGTVRSVRASGRPGESEIAVEFDRKGTQMHNGDGFAFITRDGITGFRGDVCEGDLIRCKTPADLKPGATLYRNINSAFEKELDARPCRREIPVWLDIRIHSKFVIEVKAVSQDGRQILSTFNADVETAQNRERAEAMLREQLGKRSGIFAFSVRSLAVETPGGALPLLSASTINSIRRLAAEDISASPCICHRLATGTRMPDLSNYKGLTTEVMSKDTGRELMRSKYCVRHELGLCPKQTGKGPATPMEIRNAGRSLRLEFDCRNCEMTVTQA